MALMHHMVHILPQRYHREVSVCSKLSHPNIAPFIGINPTRNHPFSLIFDTTDYLGLREYLDKNPKVDKLKLVGHFVSRTRL
jgi:serine/threonine protein kinase